MNGTNAPIFVGASAPAAGSSHSAAVGGTAGGIRNGRLLHMATAHCLTAELPASAPGALSGDSPSSRSMRAAWVWHKRVSEVWGCTASQAAHSYTA